MEQAAVHASKEIGAATKREEYMDVFRALGIIAMILGHIRFGSRFDHLIHAFHMPMFFFVSGFFFRHKSREELSFWRYLLKKTKSLLLPYFVFGLFHLAVSWVLLKNHDVSQIYHLFLFNNSGLPIAGALWFLTALFLANIIYFLIDRYIPNVFVKAVVIIAIAIFGNFSGSLVVLPFSMNAAFVGVGLMYLGSLVKRYQDYKVMKFLLNLGILPLALLCGVTVVLIFVNGYVNMRTGTYAMILLFWLNALLAIFAGINISKLLTKAFRGTAMQRYLLSVGGKSIICVCLNQIIIECVGIFDVTEKIIVFAATMFLLYLIAEIVYQTPLKLIVGQKVQFKELFFFKPPKTE